MSRFLHTLAALALVSPLPAAADAQADSWRHSLDIFLMGPTLDGAVGIGPVDGDVDIDAGTVFDSLEAAFLGTYVGERGRWGVIADLAYMDLAQDGQGPAGLVDYEVSVKQTLVSLYGTYRLSPTWQATFGARWTDVSSALALQASGPGVRAETDEDWIDPMIGLRWERVLDDKVVVSLMGDLAGFGVGSDLTLFLGGTVAYRFSERVSGFLGYRYIDIDYEDGAGRDRFRFDMVQHGPLLGIRFAF